MSNRRETPRLPPGHPPWDPINGLRVGGLAGGLVGILVMLLLGMRNPWLAIVGAAVGATIGFVRERRKQRPPPERPG
jgi:uncharacterized membrane protein